MDKLSNVAYAVVALLVMVLIIATVAIPVIENAQVGDFVVTETDDNTGAAYKYATVKDEVTISPVLSDINITYGSSSYSVSRPASGTTPILITEDFAIFATTSATYLYGSFMAEETTPYVIEANAEIIKLSNGSLKIYEDGSAATPEYTSTYKTAYVYKTDGDYGAWASSDIDINVDPKANVMYLATGSGLTIGKGNIGNMAVSFALNGSSEPVTNATIALTHAEVAEQIAEEVTAVTVTGSIYTNGYLFAPITYSIAGEYTDGPNSALLGVVPLMLLMVPILFCVKIFAGRSD